MCKSGFVQKAEPPIAACFHQAALLGKCKTAQLKVKIKEKFLFMRVKTACNLQCQIKNPNLIDFAVQMKATELS